MLRYNIDRKSILEGLRLRYSVNLFGRHVDSELILDNGKLILTINEDETRSLLAYLRRALDKYVQLQPEDTATNEALIRKAIEVEETLPGHLNEPTVKLPYEVTPETKQKLIEAAEIQKLSATKLLIRLIEQKYQEVLGK